MPFEFKPRIYDSRRGKVTSMQGFFPPRSAETEHNQMTLIFIPMSPLCLKKKYRFSIIKYNIVIATAYSCRHSRAVSANLLFKTLFFFKEGPRRPPSDFILVGYKCTIQLQTTTFSFPFLSHCPSRKVRHKQQMEIKFAWCNLERPPCRRAKAVSPQLLNTTAGHFWARTKWFLTNEADTGNNSHTPKFPKAPILRCDSCVHVNWQKTSLPETVTCYDGGSITQRWRCTPSDPGKLLAARG